MKSIINEELKPMLDGLTTAASIVGSTMGKHGKTVIIGSNDSYEKLKFSQDGVTVANSITLEDYFENIGVQILKSAANKTVEQCGDGTTLTSVLLHSMVYNTFSEIAKKDSDINEVLDQLEEDVQNVIKLLNKESRNVKSNKQIQSIATVSSKNKVLGQMFKDIFDQTKDFDTFINLEKTNNINTYFDHTVGIHYSTETGYWHPSYMTRKDTEQCIYENCNVHIEYSPIRQVTANLQKMLEYCSNNNSPLLILAPSFSDAVHRLCSMNKVNNGVPVVLAKLPGYGNAKIRNAEDIEAFLTDGCVDKAVLTQTDLALYNDKDMTKYVHQLEAKIPHSIDNYEKESIYKRIHKLKQTAVTIYAGGRTLHEQEETYLRLEDAIGAVRSAIQQGYVAGGGTTLAYLSTKTNNTILKNALLTPLFTILNNANITELDINKITNKVGINTTSRKYVDMYKEGIIDPTKVLIKALSNSLANTKLLVNTSCSIYNEYKTTI